MDALELARLGYEAWREEQLYKPPDWENLAREQQDGWELAASAIANAAHGEAKPA